MPLENMFRSFGSDLLDAVVVGLPLLTIFVVLRARTTRAVGSPRARWYTACCEAGLAASIALIAIVTLLPSGLPEDGPRHIQWDVFASDLTYAPERTQVLGNLALFAPLGLFVCLCFGRAIALAVAGVSPLAVEVAQHIAVPGRVATIEDVALGSAGCLVAVLAGDLLRRLGVNAGQRTSVRASAGQ